MRVKLIVVVLTLGPIFSWAAEPYLPVPEAIEGVHFNVEVDAEWQGSLIGFPESTRQYYAQVFNAALKFVADSPIGQRSLLFRRPTPDFPTRLPSRRLHFVLTKEPIAEGGFGNPRIAAARLPYTEAFPARLQSLTVKNNLAQDLYLFFWMNACLMNDYGHPNPVGFSKTAYALASQLLGYGEAFLRTPLEFLRDLNQAFFDDTIKFAAQTERAFVDDWMKSEEFVTYPRDQQFYIGKLQEYARKERAVRLSQQRFGNCNQTVTGETAPN